MGALDRCSFYIFGYVKDKMSHKVYVPKKFIFKVFRTQINSQKNPMTLQAPNTIYCIYIPMPKP